MKNLKQIRILSILSWGFFLITAFLAYKINFEFVKYPLVISIFIYLVTQGLQVKTLVQSNQDEDEIRIKILGVVFAGFVIVYYMLSEENSPFCKNALWVAAFIFVLKCRFELKYFIKTKLKKKKR